MLHGEALESFLLDEGVLDWPEINNEIFFCRFDASHYHDDLYKKCAIEFGAGVKMAVTKRKAEYLAGRYCASKALSRFGQRYFVVKSGSHGEPLWPQDLRGSISHTQTLAVATVNKSGIDVGIDVEQLKSKKTFLEIEEIIATESECKNLDTPNQAYWLNLAIVFSMKESFFKAVFNQVKQYLEFSDVFVSRINIRDRELTLKLVGSLSDNLIEGQEYTGHFYLYGPSTVVTYIAVKGS